MSGTEISLSELIKLKAAAKGITLGAHTAVATATGSGYRSRLRGRGIEFEEVRAYSPGDDIRHMDWRVTARTGEAHTKLYQAEHERPVVLLIDYNPSMFFATKVAYKAIIAAKIAALLGWTALQKGDRLGGLIFQNNQQWRFKPGSREQALLPLLQALSQIHKPKAVTNENNTFASSLQATRSLLKPGSLLIIISDFMEFTEAAKKQIALLRERHSMMAIQINDPIEISAPPPGLYVVSDGNAHRLINTQSAQQNRLYEQQFQENQEILTQFLSSQRIQHVHCLTTDDPVMLIKRSLYGR